MKRKLVAMTALTISLSALMSGCGIFDKENDKEENTTIHAENYSSSVNTEESDKSNTDEDNSGTDEKDTTEETTEPESKNEEQPTVNFDGDIYSLSNEPVGWGVGVQVDAGGRPTSPLMLQNQYGDKYAVEFIKEDEKVIYLTFDEGYENGYTAAILDTLKEKNVKAVFFITMPYAKAEPELIKRMIDEGHVVGSHSVTHPSMGMPSLSVEEQMKEYTELEKYVLDTYGYKMWLFRPPTGRFSEQSLAIAQKCGYRSIMWSFAYKDWITDEQPEVSWALENAVNKLHNGAIYLLHAVSKTNTEMLGDFIDQTRAKGYVFKEYK